MVKEKNITAAGKQGIKKNIAKLLMLFAISSRGGTPQRAGQFPLLI